MNPHNLTVEEIAGRIRSKYESITYFDPVIIDGKIDISVRKPDLLFDITNVEPQNADDILDWFNLGRQEIIEVIDDLSAHLDIKKVSDLVATFIKQQNINEEKEMYLVPFVE